jgi:hypothetical protein
VLDSWLLKLERVTELFNLNQLEVTIFAASRLTGAAQQWWRGLSLQQREEMKAPGALAAALRRRFQPVSVTELALEQLDALAQGGRPVNDYIADFQRLHALVGVGVLSEVSALHAFKRGLRADIAEMVRLQGVKTLEEAIHLAARTEGLTARRGAQPSGAQRAASIHQMEMDMMGEDRLAQQVQQAVINALHSQGASSSGLGAKTQTMRGYQEDRTMRGGAPGGRGVGRSGRGGFSSRPLPAVPGLPPALVEQRRAAGQCYRCGSGDHRSTECPNPISAAPHLN